jgi:endonuclease I
MNKVAFKLIALIFPILAMISPVQADVLLSELCDPQSNYLTDRFIEIYNSGPDEVSLTGWSVIAVGNTDDIFTWNLSGTILPNQALVCGDLNTVIDFQVDFPEDAWSTSNATWNGKIGDGAKLRNNSGSIIDYVVVPGTTFENADMERNENILQPNPSYNAAEWSIHAVSYPTDGTPGSHHAPPPPVGPTILNVVTDPVTPQVGDTVDVSADITDDNAAITNVVLNWGLADDALNNSIPMSLAGGVTYTTTSPIPAQAMGSSVFFQVAASNDEPATTLSGLFDFGVPFTVSIQDIQGTGDISPHLGHEVITEGVVTSVFSGTWVIQDGSGARSGLWLEGGIAPGLGTYVVVQGAVEEISGNTTLTGVVISSSSAGSMPAAEILTTGAATSEDFEGVFTQVFEATCTSVDASDEYWYVSNDGSDLRVDDLGATYAPTIGSVYTLRGPLSGNSNFSGIVPRYTSDIIFVTDPVAPSISSVEAQGPTAIIVLFSEPVDEASAEIVSNYTVSGCSVSGAQLIVGQTQMVELTVSTMTTGLHTLTVDGVMDLFGNAMDNVAVDFQFYGGNVPPGYYDSAIGLEGEVLQSALHNIIDNHNSVSYTYLWTAFYTTDDKPDGTVWDMYSDVPGGVPPYIYEFGIDQTGDGAAEGSGYNREHSWPQSWYGGLSPMYTDLFIIYPTDVRVNGFRSNYPYGEVGSATWTSLNGSKLGSSSYPGYSGTVFEPIDEYKGDFARSYFYMGARYFGEDGSWVGSPQVDGAQLVPWAEAMMLEWHLADPVSTKEIDRNDAVYDIQHNRNPFIDRPDFVLKVYGSEMSAAPEAVVMANILLHQNVPNPFNPSTTISYELKEAGPVQLQIFDVAGRLVRNLVQEEQAAGPHQMNWNGRGQEDQTCAAGVYFYRIRTEGADETKRMLLVK